MEMRHGKNIMDIVTLVQFHALEEKEKVQY